MTGIYVILIELNRPNSILAGKKHRFDFQKGFYGYVGSALSGLEKRLERHLGSRKRPHWHVDYLLRAAKIRNIICAETSMRKECMLAQTLSQRLPLIAGFGCSDCNCQSHLFFCQDFEVLKVSVFDAFKSLELNPTVYI